MRPCRAGPIEEEVEQGAILRHGAGQGRVGPVAAPNQSFGVCLHMRTRHGCGVPVVGFSDPVRARELHPYLPGVEKPKQRLKARV